MRSPCSLGRVPTSVTTSSASYARPPVIIEDLHTIADLRDPDQIRRDSDAGATRWPRDQPWITRTMHRTVRVWLRAPAMRASRQWGPCFLRMAGGTGVRGDAATYPSTEDACRRPRSRSKRPSCSTGGCGTTCCTRHVAPAQAFCDALRARDQIALWIASRGFGGKTFLLALFAAANAILFETDVIILGGSGQQSLRVVEQLHGLWAAGQVPPAWLASAPTFNKTTLAWGNMIQALTASQTAVRGAHPTRLLLDEIDEMKLPILEAAQGQPMDRNGVQAQTVMSSTHQYPDGTVTAMRCRAAELDWPVSQWCYRETLKPHGWLTADQVERKRRELSRTMWAVEYELQEPSA